MTVIPSLEAMNRNKTMKWKTIVQCALSARLKLPMFATILRQQEPDSDRYMRTIFARYQLLNKSVYCQKVTV
jgi:hypothetical protein